jgi:hypothetical protein
MDQQAGPVETRNAPNCSLERVIDSRPIRFCMPADDYVSFRGHDDLDGPHVSPVSAVRVSRHGFGAVARQATNFSDSKRAAIREERNSKVTLKNALSNSYVSEEWNDGAFETRSKSLRKITALTLNRTSSSRGRQERRSTDGRGPDWTHRAFVRVYPTHPHTSI